MKRSITLLSIALMCFGHQTQLRAQSEKDSKSESLDNDSKVTDSLRQVLNATNLDSVRCELYIEITKQYFYESNLEKALKTCNDGLRNLRENDYQVGVVKLSILKRGVFQNSNRPKDAKRMDRRIKTVSDSIGYTMGQFYVHNKMGYYYKDRLIFDSAIYHFKKALELAIKMNNKEYETNLNASIAYVLFDSDRDGEALDYLNRSYDVAIEMDEPKAIASALNNLGSYYKNASNYSKSLAYFLKSLEIYESIEFSYMVAGLNNNIGDVYAAQRRFKKALDFYETALQTNIEIQNTKWQAINYINLASTHIERNDFELALENAQKALRISTILKDNKSICADTLVVGHALEKLGDYKAAYSSYIASVSLAEEYQLITEYSSAQQSLAELFLMLSKDENVPFLSTENSGKVLRASYLQKALEHINRAVENDMKIEGYLREKAERKKEQSEIYYLMNKPAPAYLAYREYNALKDSVFSLDKEKQLATLDYKRQLLTDSLENEQAKLAIESKHKEEILKKDKQRMYLAFSGIAVLLLAGGLYGRLRYTNKTKRIIEKEKNRSEELLLNILPAEVAEELKNTGASEAQQFDQVSILFTDFKGFTETAEKLSAKELVNEINTCYKAFDNISDKYGIEKIKTIGDSYMAASGLGRGSQFTDDGSQQTVNREQTTVNLTLAALEMQEFIKTRSSQLGTHNSFLMRAGIHTGPVVAGIVGVKKFQYDIWGDTVNTASRMESHGEVGKVNISQATFELLQHDPSFSFEEREQFEVKGKGKKTMFFVSTKDK